MSITKTLFKIDLLSKEMCANGCPDGYQSFHDLPSGETIGVVLEKQGIDINGFLKWYADYAQPHVETVNA